MWGDKGIVDDLILCHVEMVQLGLMADFGYQLLEWDDTVTPMKDPGNFLGQPERTKPKMREVVIQTVEPSYTR